MKEIVIGPDVDTMILARGTPGFSGADLQNMVKYVVEFSASLGYLWTANQSSCYPGIQRTSKGSCTEALGMGEGRRNCLVTMGFD